MTTRREPHQGSEVRKGLGVRYRQYGRRAVLTDGNCHAIGLLVVPARG